MWNENLPLELLKDMPTELNEENTAKIQRVIDVDKYKNSEWKGYDLCGEYAPFCKGCDKWIPYPCAYSYIKMKQAEGMEVKINEDVCPRKIKIATAKRKVIS
ncbi:MAG: hypothetical protein E7370_01620 [Clostridiales bacterium]|nr:hypothetical protein [Clostridiales bacterium]